ncbi:MAG: hypothetical protein ACTJHT_00920 [Sphingobacterium sp.]|uniref:hypothetical protein n=1 Tax=Sphingobacterium sp. JB170 TaxID=1434842 RepID=UPI00097F5629|nr:hypothetical protein [Sphingobacterium sp. JB170]SJN49347.1 hypothetical protein FM107_18520 [Sphingobacterium sp. JB170]
MEFSPFNKIVKLFLQGMDMEENAKPKQALQLFLQGWNAATNDFKKYLTETA